MSALHEGLERDDDLRGPEPLRAIAVDSQTDPRWRRFVSSHPKALPYHHPAYLRVLEQEYGHAPLALACVDDSGRFQGVLPLLDTGRRLSGGTLRCLPLSNVTGPLVNSHHARDVLVSAAIERVQRGPERGLQLRLYGDDGRWATDHLKPVRAGLTYMLDLPSREENLRFGSSRNHGAVQRAVRKALKSGVQVRQAESKDDLARWYHLYLLTMRHHGAPAFPYHYFQSCWELLRPIGLMRLLVAEREEAGRTVMLAGSIFFTYGETVLYAYNGRRADMLALRPNDAIHWQAIHDACRAGYRRYDFGPAREDDRGLSRYKTKWGAAPIRLYHWQYPHETSVARAALRAESPTRRALTVLWRRLPLPVTAAFGRVVWDYLQ